MFRVLFSLGTHCSCSALPQENWQPNPNVQQKSPSSQPGWWPAEARWNGEEGCRRRSLATFPAEQLRSPDQRESVPCYFNGRVLIRLFSYPHQAPETPPQQAKRQPPRSAAEAPAPAPAAAAATATGAAPTRRAALAAAAAAVAADEAAAAEASFRAGKGGKRPKRPQPRLAYAKPPPPPAKPITKARRTLTAFPLNPPVLIQLILAFETRRVHRSCRSTILSNKTNKQNRCFFLAFHLESHHRRAISSRPST